jgi:hypothetical protein
VYSIPSLPATSCLLDEWRICTCNVDGVQKCAYRKVLEQKGPTQKVELETVGTWRFMLLSGEIHTRLIVLEVIHRSCLVL